MNRTPRQMYTPGRVWQGEGNLASPWGEAGLLLHRDREIRGMRKRSTAGGHRHVEGSCESIRARGVVKAELRRYIERITRTSSPDHEAPISHSSNIVTCR